MDFSPVTPPPVLSSSPAAENSTDFAPGAAPASPIPVWKSVAVLALSLVVYVFFWIKPSPTIPSQAGVVMNLPGYVRSGSGFVGTPAPVTTAELNILPKDTEFARDNYSDFPDQDQIFCGIVLSGAMQQSIHRPEVCLVAQGWTIVEQENIPIQLPSGHRLTVKNLKIRKNVTTTDGRSILLTQYNMYWFVGEKTTTSEHWMRIFLSSWDRIVHNRAHRWAYVTVASTITEKLIPNGKNAEQTKAMMIDFIKAIVPTFQKSEMPAATWQGKTGSNRAPS
jgi:hypothetical protein